VDGKEFSTVNIMRAHFEKSHKKDAIAWFEKLQGGEVISARAVMCTRKLAFILVPHMLSSLYYFKKRNDRRANDREKERGR
jgi:hypothetical protein